jgi:DNA-binding NarL/FixJ family response regulator
LIVDRQPLFTAALGSLLAAPPLSAAVWTASRSDEALEMVRSGGIDVVFCDIGAEPMSGRQLAKELAALRPPVPVIVLGGHDEGELMEAAVASSAAGLFAKDASLDELLVGVRAVLSGHRAIGASLMGRLLDRLAQVPSKESRRTGGRLSPTEVEILAMVGRAASIPSIAETRGISHKTVRNHLAKIYRKLELHGRTEAMLWAARQGLIDGQG